MRNKKYTLKHKGIKLSIGLVALLALGSTLAGCGKQKPTQSKAPSVSRKASKPKQKVLKQLPTNMMHMYNSTNRKQTNVKELINSNNIIVNQNMATKKNKKAKTKTKNTTININEITKHNSSYHIIGKANNKVMTLTLTPSNDGKTVQIDEPALKLNFKASVQQDNPKMNKNKKSQKKNNKKQGSQNNKNKKQNNNNKALKPNKLPKH